MTKAVALYARVSSERQVQQATIESQLAALRARAASDGCVVLPNDEYVDNGHSGSTLLRPALEPVAQVGQLTMNAVQSAKYFGAYRHECSRFQATPCAPPTRQQISNPNLRPSDRRFACSFPQDTKFQARRRTKKGRRSQDRRPGVDAGNWQRVLKTRAAPA